MKTLAILDDTGLLTGYRQVADKDWKTKRGQVAVPDQPDLAPGRYRYHDERKTFEALPPAGSQEAAPPDAIYAIAVGFMEISKTVVLPEATLDWLEAYTKTWDGRGIVWTRPKP